MDPDRALALCTWTCWGSWLAGPGRGGIESRPRPAHAPAPGASPGALPEPDPILSRRRRVGLRWPAVRLDRHQQEVVLEDLARLARLRRFEPMVAAVAADHVHLLLAPGPGVDPVRLVQLVKGSLSRALSVAGGDAQARATDGTPLPHRKWWSRQHSLRWIDDEAELARVRQALLEHERGEASVRRRW